MLWPTYSIDNIAFIRSLSALCAATQTIEKINQLLTVVFFFFFFFLITHSGILPPPNAYVAMMGICARNPKAPNTSRIFTLYEELKKNYNMAEIDKSDAITLINTIISACAHSTDPDREAKSLIILGEAKKYNLPFTNHTYNSLLYLYIYLHQMDKVMCVLTPFLQSPLLSDHSIQ